MIADYLSLDVAFRLFSGHGWMLLLWTLAHSLWQGVVLAVLLAGVLSGLSAKRSELRYAAATLTMLALVFACLVTWSVLGLRGQELRGGMSGISQGSISDSGATRQGAPLVNAVSPAVNAVSSLTKGASSKGLVPSGPVERFSWPMAVAPLWLAGVVTMLLRASFQVTCAHQWAKGEWIDDPRLQELVESLRKRLRIRRSIRIVETAKLGPAVMGVFRPTLLLPIARLSGMPPEALEAILAHELAHIRRHDYLVNLLQMFVEAMLFFNPAVWWISRQIRGEREACCDAMAVRSTGEPIAYAQALADWLETSRGLSRAASMAAVAIEGDGPVLERIRRLICSDYRPELRASWRLLLGGLFVSAVALVLLGRGTQVGVAFVHSILSPAERVAELDKLQDQLRPVFPQGSGKAILSVKIETWDGKPAPKHLDASLLVRNENGTSQRSINVAPPECKIETTYGSHWLAVFAEGYAPVQFGPLEVRPDAELETLKVVLEPGFQARLLLENGRGEPIADGNVSASLHLVGGNTLSWRGNELGQVFAEHLANLDYDLTIRAPGHQSLGARGVRFDPNEARKWILREASPTTGIVVGPEGAPIAGAVLRSACRLGPDNGGQMDGSHGPILATTAADGTFTLDALDDGAIYAVLVETAKHGRRLFRNVTANQKDLRFVVGPDLVVQGSIVGDLRSLAIRRGEPIVTTSQPINISRASDFSYSFSLNDQASVEEGGKFTIRNLLPGKLFITAGKRTIGLEVENPATEVVMNVEESVPSPTFRKVVLRFTTPDPGLFPTGQLWIASNQASFAGAAPAAKDSLNFPQIEKVVAIENGVVELDAYSPGLVSYSPRNVVGYWFEGGVIVVKPGEGELVHVVQAIPAGGVRGEAKNADGSPASEGVQLNASSAPSRFGWFASRRISVNNIPVDAQGRFLVSPLPLGGSYVIAAGRGYEKAVVGPITVDEDHPSPSAILQFGESASAFGLVLDSDGQPVEGATVQLTFEYPGATTSYSPAVRTGSQGRFHFDRVSKNVGAYRVRVTPPGASGPAANVSIQPGGQPLSITIPAGPQ